MLPFVPQLRFRVSIFMLVVSLLREIFSVLVTGLEQEVYSIINLNLLHFLSSLMILQEIITELSNPLEIYIYINGTALTLATLFSWLWWSASVLLEFCMGLLCSGGS